MRIAFIGGGAMAEAMVKCLLDTKAATRQDLVVSDVSSARRELFNREYGVNALADNGNAVKNADLIVLAVKPQNLLMVMREINVLSPEQAVLSVVAGVTLENLCQGLNHLSVIRAMPNMPAQIGEGMTVWIATEETSQEQKDWAQSALRTLGKEVYVTDEKYLSMATALSGSGPAYVFLFIETLIDAGVHIGLPRDMAQKLVIQTVIGSAWTVEKTGKHPADLRNMVTSPGGTTTEALIKLERGGFRSLLLDAVAAANEKARQF